MKTFSSTAASPALFRSCRWRMKTARNMNREFWRWLRCPPGLAVVVRLFSTVANASPKIQDDHEFKKAP